MKHEPGQRSWKYRRRAAFGLILFGCAGLAYLLGWGDDIELHRKIASGLVTIVIATVSAYIGEGSWTTSCATSTVRIDEVGRAVPAAAAGGL